MKNPIELTNLVDGCHNFFWREILYVNHWEVCVFPNPDQYYNLIYITKRLQKIRTLLNKPITITSGLRPPVYNRLKKVGGAKNSRHTYGMALDFIVRDMTCDEVREFIVPRLEELGIRCEDRPGSNWIHIDGPYSSGNRFFKP